MRRMSITKNCRYAKKKDNNFMKYSWPNLDASQAILVPFIGDNQKFT